MIQSQRSEFEEVSMSKPKPKPQPKKNPFAVGLGRLGGSRNTPKQNEARARNAKFAGRPRRVCVHCRKPVFGFHVDRTLDETCGIHQWTWQKPSER